MKVLIIGGTGILSMEVCKAVAKDNEVYCINRGNKKELNTPNVNTIIANIRDTEDVKNKIKDIEFDVVIDFLSYNLEQLKNTLMILENRMKHYVFISSATAYLKKDENEIIDEDTTPIGNPLWEYALNKVKCEEYIRSLKDLNYTIIRPYVTYGKNRIPFAVISEGNYWALANRILLGKPIIMWDDGEAICTITHSSDFAEAVKCMLLNEKAYGEAFHITSTEQLRWKDVLAGIEKALGKKANVIYMPSTYIEENMPMYKGTLLGDKATNMRFSNRKLKEFLPEFECKIKFDDGIKDTIDFYRNNKFMRAVDYKWDALMDRMIIRYYKENSIKYDRKLFRCTNYEEKPSFKDRLKHAIFRNKNLYTPINGVYQTLKKIVKRK